MAHYTVGEFAKKAGISARTLRHYDEMGLLKPAAYSEGGYRLYEDKDLASLQRIVALRYLGFSLPEIGAVLKMEKGQDIQKSLRQQREEFRREQEHLRQIIQAMDALVERPQFQWEELINLIQLINAEEQVQKRFIDSRRREQCVDLHLQYSTNPDNWLRFLYRQMDIRPGQSILEIDAADGSLWAENADRLPSCHLTLTSSSESILDKLRQDMEQAKWENASRFDYALLPSGHMTLPEKTYDVIVANHLFIHGTELSSILAVCHNALKPGGGFYCTAIGENHMKELLDLAKSYEPAIHFYNMDCLQNFSCADGAARLAPYFEQIQWHPYEDTIETDNAQALLQYVWGSYSNVKEVLAHKKEGLLQHFQKAIVQSGKVEIRKEQGIFSARRPL